MKTKNIILGAFASLLMMGAVGCSDDNLIDPITGDGSVTFSVNLADQPNTRALGDGTAANTLYYAVYDKDHHFVTKGTATVSNLTATVNITLTRSQVYDIVFFAYCRTGNAYSFEEVSGKVSIDYSQYSGTSKKYGKDHDCFYQIKKGFVAGSSAQENIILYRPMAQINFGTDDFDDFLALKGMYSGSTYFNVSTTAYTTFNLLTGEGEDPKPTNFQLHRYLDNDKEFSGQFPVAGYTYLATAYVLIDPSQNLDVALNVADNNNESSIFQTLEVPNVPAKRNYRTNIYGSLLTAQSNWKVEIEPIYEGDLTVWGGNIEEPKQDANGNYIINTPAELAGLSKMVNAGKDFAGDSVLLNADMDLASINWTPIGTFDKPFNGIFDGKGHTISNLKVVLGNKSCDAGLFGAVKQNNGKRGELRNFTIDGAEINTLAAVPCNAATGVALGRIYTGKCVEGVTVKNAKIDAYRWAGGVVGKGYGSVNNNTAENVTITMHFEKVDGEYDNADKAGGIIGQQDEGMYNIMNNTVKNVYIKGYRHLGGVAGHILYGQPAEKLVSGNTVTTGEILQDLTQNYKSIEAGTLIGELFGYVGDKVKEESNVATDVKLVYPKEVSTPESLVEIINNGGYATLGADMDLTNIYVNVTLDKPVILNLNGNSLKVKGGAVIANSDLTIEGTGNIVSDGITLIGGSNSNITINGGTIESTSTDEYLGSAINTSGSMEINGGTFISINRDAVSFNWANENTGERRAVINGGTFQTAKNYSLFIYAANAKADKYVEINGGTFYGTSGARVDGKVEVVINDGIFIQDSNNSTGHGLCVGAESSGSGAEVVVNGGYFHGGNGFAICCTSRGSVTVNNAYLNKLNGGYTLGSGSTVTTLTAPVSKMLNINGVEKTFNFGYLIK